MTTTSVEKMPLQLLRELLGRTSDSSDGSDAARQEPDGSAPDVPASTAPCLLYFTSDWAAPVDARVHQELQQAAANVRVVMLRQHLLDDADSSSAQTTVASTTERAVVKDTFRALCKHFGITALPSCIVVDAVRDFAVVNAAESQSSLSLLFGERPSVLANLHTSAQRETSESQLPEPELAKMRDDATNAFESGDFLAAARRFMEVLIENPCCQKSNFNLAVILQMMGETYFAVHFMLQVVSVDDSDSVAHTVLRSVYYQEEPQAVVAGYEAIIARTPHHVRAVHSLATLQGEATTAAPAYVKEVFDELADTFEEKLVMHLEYRVPWLLVDALKKVEPSVFTEVPPAPDATAEFVTRWKVADVGCGTGLCGRLLRPFVSHIVGVDISPLMIEKTREAGSYDELHTDDIGPFLSKREDMSLDLVISADVWIYVGALEEIFALCARKLATHGWLAFSTELLQHPENGSDAASGAGFKLAASGRFQHSEAYIAALAKSNGFQIRLQEAIGVRKESGEAILGRIYLLQQTDSTNNLVSIQ